MFLFKCSTNVVKFELYFSAKSFLFHYLDTNDWNDHFLLMVNMFNICKKFRILRALSINIEIDSDLECLGAWSRKTFDTDTNKWAQCAKTP